MLYSYRHPDLAAVVAASEEFPKISPLEAARFEERRRFVRLIPVAVVVHGNDADVWSLWDQAVESEAAIILNDTTA